MGGTPRRARVFRSLESLGQIGRIFAQLADRLVPAYTGLLMTQTKTAWHEKVPPSFQPLVEQLAALGESDRERIIGAARAVARGRGRPTIRRDHLREACGIVSWGGDAVEDTRALYDG